MGEDEVESEGWSYVFLHTRTLKLPSRQIVGNSRQLSSLSPLFWQIVDNRRRPRRSLLKTLQSITLSLQNENHKNCPFSLSGVLYLSPLSRRPSPALKVDILRRAHRFGRASGSLCPFFCPVVVVDVRFCGARRWDVGCYSFPGASGPIILLGVQKTRLHRVGRSAWLRGNFQLSPVWHEITNVEDRRNSPVGLDGDVVCVSIDFPANLETTGCTRM